jgi:hypothetical protein
MEEDETPDVPVDFNSMVSDVKERNDQLVREEMLEDVLGFMDKMFRAANVVFDQQVEPRGFESAEEEQAIATCLSILLTITKGIRTGPPIGLRLYLQVLEEVERDAVRAYELLVANRGNAGPDQDANKVNL